MHVDSWGSSIDFQLTKSKAFDSLWIKAILHAGSLRTGSSIAQHLVRAPYGI